MWMGFFQEKSIFSYARCGNCGLLYAPVFFNMSQLQELYANMPPNMEVVPTDALSRTQAGYYDYLKSAIPKTKGSFLEIGPDVGLFTRHCMESNQFNKFWLFEPNQCVEQQLRDLLSDQQYQISHEISNLSIVPSDSVSVCVMIHVLDHLLNPRETLVQLKAKMKKESVMMIVTHDEGSLLAQLFGVKWPAYCLQHPQLYNRETIRSTLADAGLRVTKQVKTRNVFPISFLAKNLFWSLGVPQKIAEILPSAMLRLKLGNILTIAVPR